MPSSVHAIYCDDVRQEVGNKLSYMGIYSHSLNVPQFPYVMPKLAIAITVETPIGEPYRSLRLELRADDEHVIYAEDAQPGELNDGRDLPSHDPLGMPYTMWFYSTTFMFTPFTFGAACMLRVVAFVDGVECKGGVLRVRELKAHDPS